MHPTKIKLLDAAEHLFATDGYDGTSMRAILAAAGFDGQLALLHYHFGTKLDVYRAVWERAIAEIGAGRDERHAGIMPGLSPADDIRQLVEAFFLPPLAAHAEERGRLFLTIMSREVADPRHIERGLVRDFLEPGMRKLVEAFGRLLPDISPATVEHGVRTMLSVAQSFLKQGFGPAGQEEDVAGRKEAFDVAIEIFVGGWLRLAGLPSDQN